MRFSRQYAAALVFAIGLVLIGLTAQADSQGPNFSSTLGSQREWVNDGNALGANDNVCATTSLGFADIDVTGFGFSISAGVAITGIKVELKVARTSGSNFSIQLLKAGTPAGAGKTFARPNTGATSCGTSDFVALGGDGDLWGTTWTPDQINASRFGVRIDSGGIDNATRFLDAVKVTVYYTMPTAGTIIIIKDAVSNDQQDFSFSTTGGLVPATFTLDDDDADPTLPNTQTFTGLAPGTYTVTEADPSPGFLLTAINCTAGGSGDVPSRTATITLTPGATVTCTFVNEKQLGTIVINKSAVGGNDTFNYTATGTGLPASFQITTSGGSGSQTFANLNPGAYTVTEQALPASWDFTNLVCVGPDNGTTIVGQTANIDLDAGETVICTFTNTKSDVDLVVTKTDDVDPVAIDQLVTYTITVTNNGPSDAPNVTITDTLPASGVTFVSATPSQGGPCTKVNNVVTCPMGTIANDNNATVTIQVRYTTTGTKTNTVSASSMLPDLNPSNNVKAETTTVSDSCPGVTFMTTTPSSITFAYVGQRRRVTVRVENLSGAAIQVNRFEPQLNEPFTVVSVIPTLPRTIADGEVRRFYLIVKGTALATATIPYFFINTSCGVVTTASDPRLLVPLQLGQLQAEVRSGYLYLEALGAGIESVRMELFDLHGRTVIDRVNRETILTVPLVHGQGGALAKGVYLYRVTLYGRDSSVWRSEVRKLIVR